MGSEQASGNSLVVQIGANKSLGVVCNDVSLVNWELACRSGCSIRDWTFLISTFLLFCSLSWAYHVFFIAALIFAYLFLIEQFLLHCLHVLKIYSPLLSLSICSFYFFRTLLLILGHCLLSSRLILVILSMWSHSCDIVYVKKNSTTCMYIFLSGQYASSAQVCRISCS